MSAVCRRTRAGNFVANGGTINSQVFVFDDGVLAGNGTINGDVMNNGGVVSLEGISIGDNVTFGYGGLGAGYAFDLDRASGRLLTTAAAVPEPGTLALVVGGMLILGLRRLSGRALRIHSAPLRLSS